MIKGNLFLAVAVCLFLVCPASAQNFLVVNEAETDAVLMAKTAKISLVAENRKNAFAGHIALELLDIKNNIRSKTSENRKIKSGKQIYKIGLPLFDLMETAQNEIAWYRLRYRISDVNGERQTEGIVSLSEIMKDVFDLRVAASESVFAGMNYRTRVRAVHPFTNLPVKNVLIKGKIDLSLDTETDKLEIEVKGETDGEGFAILDFKIPPAAKLEYDGALEITGEKYGIRRKVEEDLEAQSGYWSVYMNTDKPLYQPGQTFNARGILLKQIIGENTVVPDAELEFAIKDEEGTMLYRETAKTSRFGVASISWRIPENAKLGTYCVTVSADEDLRADQIEFKVSRYDLPQFTVTVKPDQAFYLPAQKIANVEIRADYLFGKPVAKGKVRVVREGEREWNYREQKWNIKEERTFEGETNADGKFTARIDLAQDFIELGGRDYSRYEDLNFAAYFTDATTNRTEQRRFDLRLTKEAIHVYLIGETYNQNSNLPQTFYVSTFYADGSAAACSVEIKGNYEKETETKTLAQTKTNRFGAGKFEFIAPRPTEYEKDLELKITAFDDKKQTGTHEEEIDFGADDALQIQTEKAIYKAGEMVKAEIVSTKKDAFIYVDIVKDWSVVESRFARLKNGRAEVKFPFQPNFKGELTIAAYAEVTKPGEETYESETETIKSTRGIIFPEPNNLSLDAKFSKIEYRPNEEARINFSVLAPDKTPLESALGVVVFDKAIEERARTDSEFGGYRGMFNGFYDLLGYADSFGGLTMKDLNEIDLSKPVSEDLQLAAEVMLRDSYYYPEIYRDENERPQARDVFAEYIDKQLAPVEAALKNVYLKNYAHPTNDNSLREILGESEIGFENLRDPWEMKYRANFEIEQANDILTIESAGADKKFDTQDDFTVLRMSFAYFLPVGKAIDRAISDYHKETGKFVRDSATLKNELHKQNINLDDLRDRWNNAYRIDFGIDKRKFTVVVRSNGANGVFQPDDYDKDDFDVWTNETDYFTETENRFQDVLSNYASEKKSFPRDADEFAKVFKLSGIDSSQIKDGYGQDAYLTFTLYSRYSDRVKIENTVKLGEKTTQKTTVEPVTQEVVSFKLRSRGADFQEGTEDDFDLASFSGVVSEQGKSDAKPQTKYPVVISSGPKGAIQGTITDPQGAVVPNVTITAKHIETEQEFSVVSDDEGFYLIENLPAGIYNVSAEASGFTRQVSNNVLVVSKNITDVDFELSAAGMTATVEVSAGVETIETTSTQSAYGRGSGSGNGDGSGVGNTEKEVSKNKLGKNSTPRLREYFPETLVWQPELITNKNGKAELKFKLSDNITSWKLYAIASDTRGKIGVAEKEIRAFQPFFADLEPPRFLTVGDEISLPVQIRNYTDEANKVAVSMAQSDWFSFLNSANQQIEVAPNQTQNAIFGFRANAAINEGRQKVTAIASDDADAIEKPVTVKPNGKEIAQTTSEVFREAAKFEINFPAQTLPQTQRAELKIYPNLLAHVAESVEGLLQRPYGCGEQTVSSTYPNLMILKFTKEDNKLRQTAQKYLQKGYERLLGYQTADGGFSYWGANDAPDVALTAYAIRFLTDAGDFIEVDADVIKKAQSWLLKQQRADGSWTKIYSWEKAEDASRAKLITSYVARILAMLPHDEKDEARRNALQKSLDYLKARNAGIDEPYSLALFGLASLDAGNLEEARIIAAKLETIAKQENSGVYWNLETNTPFYGWGVAGRIETTALVVQLLVKVQSLSSAELKAEDKKPKTEDIISKATQFLLKNKDRYGVWYSTQTTINVLDAFVATLGNSIKETQTSARADIFLNGTKIEEVALPGGNQLNAPITVDISSKLNSSSNILEIKSSAKSSLMAQVVSNYYIGWQNFVADGTNESESRALRLIYDCDKTSPKITEDLTCRVEAERIGFKGYGMLLAEIGLPPGADVDRASLEKAREADSSFSKYEVLPDRIIVYMWAQPAGTRINFKFKPRYGITAQTAPSVVYDYYNPEAQATIAPLKFSVK